MEITFFHTDSIERLTVEEIAREARSRGYRTRFSEVMTDDAEIGVYCSHRSNPRHSKFSVVLLHDLGQRHDIWPHFWSYEPWHKFDVGLVPGQTWADLFLTAKRTHRWLAPKHGIYKVGWPKADPIFQEGGPFQRELEALKGRLGLTSAKTVLYAPSWENDGKQDDFVRAALELDCNIVVKQADWPLTTHAHIARNISEMEAKYAGHPRVKTIDRKVSIMFALALADVIVSDESSVMVEALLFGVPAIAVLDWIIPGTPPRTSSVPFDFVLKTQKAALTESIRRVLEAGHEIDYRGKRVKLEDYSNLWFSQRGGSAVRSMDILEAVRVGRRPSTEDVCTQPGYDGDDEPFPRTLVSEAKARAGVYVNRLRARLSHG